MQKFEMAAKNGRKKIFGKNHYLTLQIPWCQKFDKNISHHFQDKCDFAFMQEIKMAAKNLWKTFFSEKLPDDSGDSLRLQKPLPRKKAFLHFTQKFKMAAKNLGIKFVWKNCQMILQIPCGSKISSKSLYLTPFLRYLRFFIFIIKKNCGM